MRPRNMPRRFAAAIVVILASLLLMLSAMPTFAAERLTYHKVAGEFICQCGCNQVLKDCDTMQCGVKDKLKGIISGMLDTDQSKDGIVKYLVANYGEQIKAAPDKSGFDLTAWLMPYILAAIGAVALLSVLSGWVKSRPAAVAEGPGGGAPKAPRKVDKVYDERLEKELKDFGW